MFLREYILRVVCQQLGELVVLRREACDKANTTALEGILQLEAARTLCIVEEWSMASVLRSEHNNCTNNGDCERNLVNVPPCEGDDASSILASHTIFNGTIDRVTRWEIANFL